MPAKAKLIGRKFHRLLVLDNLGSRKGKLRWMCLCDCGNITEVASAYLVNGNTKSCGCYIKEALFRANYVHGLTKHPLHNIWNGMIDRCRNPNNRARRLYFDRGITVCDEWENDYMAFHNWAIENGWRKGMHIDRFPNKLGNYEPSNCRITTSMQNQRNRVNNRLLTFDGQTKPMSEWAQIKNIPDGTLKRRIDNLKWPIEKALTIPVISKKNGVRNNKSIQPNEIPINPNANTVFT